MRYMRDATPNARVLLMAIWELANYAAALGDVDEEGAPVIMLSVRTLSDWAQFHSDSVDYHMRNLEYAGFIKRRYEGNHFNGIVHVAPEGKMYNVAGKLVDKLLPAVKQPGDLPGYVRVPMKPRKLSKDVHMHTRVMETLCKRGLRDKALVDNMTEICAALRLAPSTVNKYMDDLEYMGLLVRRKTACMSDVILRLTQDGVAFAIDHKLIKEGA